MTSVARPTRGRSTAAATGQPQDAGAAPAHGEVELAVRRDLGRIAERDAEVVDGGLAASLITLARELDNPKNSATSKSMCARAIREGLDRLRELAPPVDADDRIDRLAKRATRKLARKPTA